MKPTKTFIFTSFVAAYLALFAAFQPSSQAQSVAGVKMQQSDAEALYDILELLKSGQTSASVETREIASALSDYLKLSPRDVSDRFKTISSIPPALIPIAGRLEQAAKGPQVAVWLLDLVLSIDRTQVEAAYQREKIIVTNRLSRSPITAQQKSAPAKRSGASDSASNEIFRLDLSNMRGASIAGLAKSQSLVKGLLVQELTGSQFAGSASQMNATVLGKTSSSGIKFSFNQKVGSMMTGAVDDMEGYLRKRHRKLPSGVAVEFSFEDHYIPKDGPSAGVACTLMVESLLKGYNYNPNFAVTGALDSGGKVGGVGGVDGKIRGAIARNCDVVAIPTENEDVIADLVIMEGVAALAKIQIIEIENFDQALKIAKKDEELDAETRKALDTFRDVQRVLNRPNGMSYLSSREVQARLRQVGATLPNHLSAKYLLLKSMGKSPTKLSLMGSVQAIDRKAAPLLIALREGDFEVEDRLAKDKFGSTSSALKRLRPVLDKRTQPCADAIVEFSDYLRTATQNPPSSNRALIELSNNIRSSGRKVNTEYERLFKREDVKKELMAD